MDGKRSMEVMRHKDRRPGLAGGRSVGSPICPVIFLRTGAIRHNCGTPQQEACWIRRCRMYQGYV